MKHPATIVALLLSGTISAISGSQTLHQQARGGVLADRFQQQARNGNGTLSVERFPGPLFQQMDTDGDGIVTLDEARSFFAGWRAERPAANAPASTPAARPKGGELQAVDAVFELCVRNVEA